MDGVFNNKGARLFKDYQNLMKIWTHPWVLKLAEIRDELNRKYDDEDSFIDDDDSDERSFSSSDSSSDDDAKMSDSGGEGTSKGAGQKRGTRRTRAKARYTCLNVCLSVCLFVFVSVILMEMMRINSIPIFLSDPMDSVCNLKNY